MKTINFKKEDKILVSLVLDDKTATGLYNAFYKHASNTITVNGLIYANEPRLTKFVKDGELVLDVHLQDKTSKVIYYNIDDDESWVVNEHKIPKKGKIFQQPLKDSFSIVLDVTKLSEDLFAVKVCYYKI